EPDLQGVAGGIELRKNIADAGSPDLLPGGRKRDPGRRARRDMALLIRIEVRKDPDPAEIYNAIKLGPRVELLVWKYVAHRDEPRDRSRQARIGKRLPDARDFLDLGGVHPHALQSAQCFGDRKPSLLDGIERARALLGSVFGVQREGVRLLGHAV